MTEQDKNQQTPPPEDPAAAVPGVPAEADQAPAGAAAAGADGSIDPAAVREEIINVLRTVYDPEIPVNIYDLGLVYTVEVQPSGFVSVVMTLTSPMCPVAGSLPPEVEMKVQAVPGVADARVELVWEPPWNMSMMTEAARLQLNLF